MLGIDQVDVNVSVTEKSTGSVSVGAGYSQSEGVILSGAISQSNIFGSGKVSRTQPEKFVIKSERMSILGNGVR